MKKVLSIVSILVMVLATVSNVALAVDPGQFNGANSTTNTSGITNLGNNIIKTIQYVGSIAAVIVLIVLGIKYMMGSTEEKAEYKKTMIPYIVGAILIFAASNIASWVFGWATTI